MKGLQITVALFVGRYFAIKKTFLYIVNYCEVIDLKNYDMPPAANEDEKIIGGILSFKQFGWLLGFFALGMLTFTFSYLIFRIKFLAIFLGICAFICGIPFAFIRKYDFSFYKYLKVKKNYNKQTKKFVNNKIA